MNKKSQSATELSLDDLLKSIEGQEIKSAPSDFKNPVLSFILAFEIGSGKSEVSGEVLYRLYRLWDKTKKYSDFSSFSSELNNYVKPKKGTASKSYYQTTKHVLELGKKIEELKKKRSDNRSGMKKYHNHFQKFLNDTGITGGTLYIEADIFYYIYNRWVDDSRKKTVLSEHNFIEICNLFFKAKKIGQSQLDWFGVNHQIKELITREEVQRWREGRIRNGKGKNIHKPSKGKKVLYRKNEKKPS